MPEFDVLFYLLFISILLNIFIGIYIMRMKNKHQIHYAFLCNILFMFIWSFSRLLQLFWQNNEPFVIRMEHISYIGVIFLPVSLLYTGIVYAKTRIKFSWYHLLFLIIPLISLFVVFTNDYHHLFIIKYSFVSTGFVYGDYYIVHEIYSYACILIGLYYLLYFSIKNSGFFSRQSILISVGILLPMLIVVLSTQAIVTMPVFVENISFTFAIFCFAFAIIKYNFLNVVPIALQTVVDNISDAFVVLDEKFTIIDYNKSLTQYFGNSLKRNNNFLQIITVLKDLDINGDEFSKLILMARTDNRTITYENDGTLNSNGRYFTIEITPIISRKIFLGILILFKDITEHKRNMEALREQQAILLEQERLASLGQLIGGIAHNLKTPIMSLAGGIEALKDLTFEYRDSIDDESVTISDHKEIAKEMLSWLEKMKPYCAYMSDVISAVKGQAVQMNESSTVKFTVDELVKRVDLLMKHELKKYHCLLKIDSQIDMRTEIKGEVNNIVQVFDNIIINAMQAYEGRIGTIDLRIVRSGDNVEFTFKDYAKGIPKQICDRLFKEMVTTKGKNGTGLGLYMSYSTIKGRFGGSMSFSSKEGSGTTFFISIPCIAYRNQEVDK